MAGGGFPLLFSKWLTDIYKTACLYTDKTGVEAWNKEISSSQASRGDDITPQIEVGLKELAIWR